ncbi:hypothetical protein [Bacillus massiliglaciei]|uniref:hypothetical protein n=1 Tax=Bacillus massiliglaciei TaxID=1816693 RepID=UPI000B0BF115|nr:hypothetical protein [Bacillus massiliglaciei]
MENQEQPSSTGYVQPQNERVLSLKDWIITCILLVIPVVNIIMLFIWAFSGDTNLNKKNYARAQLIIAGALIVLYFLFVVLIFGVMFGLSDY